MPGGGDSHTRDLKNMDSRREKEHVANAKNPANRGLKDQLNETSRLEECSVDVHASRDAVGCPAHAQNKRSRAPPHDFALRPALPFPTPNSPTFFTFPPQVQGKEGVGIAPNWPKLLRPFGYHVQPLISFEPCKTCSTSRARPTIPLLSTTSHLRIDSPYIRV